MRIAFMGTPDFSVPAYDALRAAGHEIACVYTQPPRPAGRGHKERKSPVHLRAEADGIELRTPTTLKDAAVGNCIAKAVRRWKFPKPRGGGSVIVSYPFVLQPG